MAERLPDDFLLRTVGAFIDAFKDLVLALIVMWMETRSDQAKARDLAETSRKSAEAAGATRQAPILADRRELTVKELAAVWKVSERSIYQWKDTHGLPYKRLGRQLRFDWAEVDAWSKLHRESLNNARLRVVK